MVYLDRSAASLSTGGAMEVATETGTATLVHPPLVLP